MADLAEPIASILRDYCHVEWFELAELAEEVLNARRQFDAELLKSQFETLIAAPNGSREVINSLTFNEFESDREVRDWLEAIYLTVFSGRDG